MRVNMKCKMIMNDLYSKQPNSKAKVVPLNDPSSGAITVYFSNTSPGIKSLIDSDLAEMERDAFYLRTVQRNPMGVHGPWVDKILDVDVKPNSNRTTRKASHARLESEATEAEQCPGDWNSMVYGYDENAYD